MKRVIVSLYLLFSISIVFSQTTVNYSTDSKNSATSESCKSFAPDGAWCWFSDPRAVYFEGKHKRTYAGWMDSAGNVLVGYYDHLTGEIKTTVLKEKYETDDHAAPALLFAPDGRLMVFFTKHGGSQPTLLYRMKNPEDVSEWSSQELLLNDMDKYKGLNNTNTYVNPVMLSEENNRIYLFWRGVDSKPNYSFSDDMGATWSKSRIFVLPERIYPGRRPYMKVDSNGKNKIVFAFTDGHPNAEKENSIYFMYYKQGGLYNVKGEKIGDLGGEPIQPRQASVVYDAVKTGQKAWIWDVALDDKENPVLVFTKFPDDNNHIYCYSRWDGNKWQTSDLINSGNWFPKTPTGEVEREPNYSGGLCLDHKNPSIVYLSVKRNSVFEIEKWINKDGKWKARPVTNHSGKDNVRPFCIRNIPENSPLQVLWMQNTKYIHWTDYHSTIKMNVLSAGVKK
jgi:hypothetical protein